MPPPAPPRNPIPLDPNRSGVSWAWGIGILLLTVGVGFGISAVLVWAFHALQNTTDVVADEEAVWTEPWLDLTMVPLMTPMQPIPSGRMRGMWRVPRESDVTGTEPSFRGRTRPFVIDIAQWQVGWAIKEGSTGTPFLSIITFQKGDPDGGENTPISAADSPQIRKGHFSSRADGYWTGTHTFNNGPGIFALDCFVHGATDALIWVNEKPLP